MTSYNLINGVHAANNYDLCTSVVRNEWGYMGWFVTDMINGADYMNWRDVTAGGGGGCLTSSAYDTSNIGTMAASKSAIQKDVWFQAQMKEALHHYLYNIVQSNAMNGISNTSKIVYIRTWYDNVLLVGTILLAVLTCLCLFMSLRSDFKSRKKN